MADNFNVTEDNLVCKKFGASSSLVEEKPNYGNNFEMGSGHFLVSDFEMADLGTLPDHFDVRT